MSFDAYRQYLTDIYRSPATGKPLQRDSAVDYVSRLRNLQSLLQIDLEHAAPPVLRQLPGNLRNDPVVLRARSVKFIGDVTPAIRLYADFMEAVEKTGASTLLRAAGRLKAGLDAAEAANPAGLLHDAVATIQTEVQSIVAARRGQERFRDDLFRCRTGRSVQRVAAAAPDHSADGRSSGVYAASSGAVRVRALNTPHL